MLSAAVVCLLVSHVAAVRADELRRENTRVEREVNGLRLDAMEFRYRTGRNMLVASMAGGAPVERVPAGPRGDLFARLRDNYGDQFKEAMRNGPPSPEAHARWLRGLALVERLEMAERQREDLERRGLIRRGLDPDRFPVLADLDRRNAALKSQKQTAELELKQLRGESAIRPNR